MKVFLLFSRIKLTKFSKLVIGSVTTFFGFNLGQILALIYSEFRFHESYNYSKILMLIFFLLCWLFILNHVLIKACEFVIKKQKKK